MAAQDIRRAPGRVARLFPYIAIGVAVIATWVLSRPPAEVERTRRHFAELRRQTAAARESQATRAADRNRIMRLRAQARAATAPQREAFEREAAALETRLAWGDSTTVRAAVSASPLLTVLRSPAAEGVAPVYSAEASGCVSCHVSVATPGFEKYPAPFRTHPNLLAYVGAQSPHPPSRVGCPSCHQGDGQARTFASAGHSTLRAAPTTALASAPAWADANAAGAMLPVGRTEGACITCHAGELYQPGAPALNEAFATLDRGGCYACHDVPGLPVERKRGPDLRRIRGKLSPDWVRRWLAEPHALKPATWMPAFWSGRELSADGRAEIDAVVAYLFANSDDYSPFVASAAHGDATRGRRVVESVGCLGCHVVGDASRDETSVRRTFGQPLQGLGNKTTYAWLADWVREPSRYSPDTRMPNLRLSDTDAADVASYLETLTSDPPQPAGTQIEARAEFTADDAAYRAVIERFTRREFPPPQSRQMTGDALRVTAGYTVIGALGCFNCHQIRGFEGKTTSVPIATRRVWREQDVAAIHARRSDPGSTQAPAQGPPTAAYSFGTSDTARLGLALTAVAGGRAPTAHTISMPWHVVKVSGRTLVQERNCVGCHVIEGVGGDFVKLVAEPSLGPPLLTPEGSRVQSDWLRGFLREPKTIRPWLSVRMPTFTLTDDDRGTVGGYLRAIAPPNVGPGAGQPVTPGFTANVTPAAGKELFELLKCQQCHVLGAIPKDQPTANLAPDLRLGARPAAAGLDSRLAPESVRHPAGHQNAVVLARLPAVVL